MYCERVIEEFENPFHMEILGEYTHFIENTNSGCGDEAHIYILLAHGRVKDISFQAFGCASCLATTSFLCRTVFGKELSDLPKIDREVFEEAFSELEPAQRHCIDMAEGLMDKIRKALNPREEHHDIS